MFGDMLLQEKGAFSQQKCRLELNAGTKKKDYRKGLGVMKGCCCVEKER